jgi:hypothetical protein
MRTIKTNLYNFHELSKAAQETAIEKQRNNEYNVFLDFFYDDCIELIKEKGFKGNIELQYSLSYSQGDGLSFSCDYFDNLNELFTEVLGPEKQKTINCIINNCSLKINGNNGRYCYAHRNDVNFELDNYYVKSSTNLDNLISQVESKLKDLYIDLCKELENKGYSEIEYQNSDEYIIDFFNNNEIEFYENGERQ